MFSTPISHPNHLQNTETTNSERLADAITRGEDNLKILTAQLNRLDESILDLQVSLGKYHSKNEAGEANRNGSACTEEDAMEQISGQEDSAAGVLYWLKSKQSSNQGLDPALTKDVLGIVATLARVEDDNLSRTYDGLNALEGYDEGGNINSGSCLHGAGASAGKKMAGRFLVFCLEDLRRYAGDFVADDPQRRLALPKPKLPNGECPGGFLDYAVNMINLDSKNISCVATTGQGLRETLFYSLFSRLQVYKTRTEMLQALPCITDGALSLDGGMIRKPGVFSLGSRNDVEVKFTVASGGSDVPEDYTKAEEAIRMLKWERTNIEADMRRERALSDYSKIQP